VRSGWWCFDEGHHHPSFPYLVGDEMFAAVKRLFHHEEEIETPTQAQKWHKQYQLTPDLAFLEQHSRQLIFICDDMKTGGNKHKLIEEHLPIHPVCYTSEMFLMWNKDMGTHSFPLPFKGNEEFDVCGIHKPEPARIRGELYAIPSHLFWKVLDKEKQNTVQFTRERTTITLPYRQVTYPDKGGLPKISKDCIHTVRAWMYIAKRDYWDDYIGSHLGTKAVALYEHDTPKIWIGSYYKFERNS